MADQAVRIGLELSRSSITLTALDLAVFSRLLDAEEKSHNERWRGSATEAVTDQGAGRWLR